MRSIIRLLCKCTSVGTKKGPPVIRFMMYEVLAAVGISERLGDARRVLSVSHSSGLCKILGVDSKVITEANFPEENVLDLSYSDESFDLVVADQVLEHVEGLPERAFEELFRVLRPGGYAVVTTCFINPIHDFPHDYWRFSPAGLNLLGKRHGKTVESGGWGNQLLWLYNWLGCGHMPTPTPKWHPLNLLARYNNPGWPASTWIVVKKDEKAGDRAES